MKKILEAFANDNLMINARFFEHNSEYEQALQQLCSAENKLLALLDEPLKSLYNALQEKQDKVLSLSATDKFVYGYRLGVLMTMEVFSVSETLVLGGEATI